ncbi:MAG: PLP-dependent aminotransferase family protein [Candidatus Melainabacteria bacterium]|nr:PLP-dependent aminotransferase family protein [Candidatus Melainabacteria bacterium]
MPLNVKLNRRSKVDLSDQLYHSLKQLILDGALTAGEKLPSSRELSTQLRVSRPTVAVCLEQLEHEGYVELKHGSGTYVSSKIKRSGSDGAARKNGSSAGKKQHSSPILSHYGKFVQQSQIVQKQARLMQAEEPKIAFYCWRPALDQFPHKEWARILGRHARISVSEVLDAPSDQSGEAALRKAIAALVFRFRGVKCTAEQVIIVSGLSQAIDLVARLHLDAGAHAAVEEPGYHHARLVFAAAGAKVHCVQVDAEGLNITALLKEKTPPKLVYVTPSHQFPSGQTMSLARRLELLSWAHKNSTLILEDDYDSEYQKVGKPIPALMSLDKNQSVVYAGTLNQLMFPALGLAYLVVPPGLVRAYQQARAFASAPLPPHLQNAIAQFIDDGHLDRHIKRLRSLYDERRQILTNELENKLPNQVTVTGAESGVFVLARIKTKVSTAEFVRRARQAGVGLTDTSIFYAGKPRKNEYILGFGSLNGSQIKEGVKRLAMLLKS